MTPPTPTGSSLPTGVNEPVRPTWISISLQHGHGALGREFVRDRPARRARDEAEPLLPVDAVDLVDDAVDVVVELGALLLDLAMERDQLLDRMAELGQRIGREAAALEPADHAGLGIFRHRAHLAPGIGEEAERTRGGDRRDPSGAASPPPNCAGWRRSCRRPPSAARSARGTPSWSCRPRRAPRRSQARCGL